MESWSVHHLYNDASSSLGKKAAQEIKSYAQNLIEINHPVIFTLKHLSMIAKVDYKFLHDTINRRRESINYKIFRITKRSKGYRFIHAVSGNLFKVQQFINAEILQKILPHPASFAFHSQGGIRNCAAKHCGARWLLKFDLDNFFHNINETDAYKVFRKAGYRPLLCFELARICSTTHLPKHLQYLLKECQSKNYAFYRSGKKGVLPQGAPTSPMLSNLVAFKLDEQLSAYANQYGFVYTRYADDLTFSVGHDLPEKISLGHIKQSVIRIIRECGFKENKKKTQIAGPGSKKLVLGLLVDGVSPRISKEMYKRIDRHLYAINTYNLDAVAAHEGFDSPLGFYNHLGGLIAFVKDVDKIRWYEFNKEFKKIVNPWSQPIKAARLVNL